MAATIIDWMNRIFPFVVFVFGVDSVLNGIRLRRLIAREDGVELSRTFGFRGTTSMIATGGVLIVWSCWQFVHMLKH